MTLEDDLQAAWRTGDTERAAVLEAQLTDEPRPAPDMLGAALWYAEQGLRVFPLSPGTKIPFKGSSGCLDASSNPDVIRGWWENSPNANVGIATGYKVDVVDIDGAKGQATRTEHWCYDEACRAAGSQPRPPAGWTERCDHSGIFNLIERMNVGKVSTPRPGGMHLFIPADASAANGASLGPGVDYRGLGGYVVAPPSVISDEYAAAADCTAGPYLWLGAPSL